MFLFKQMELYHISNPLPDWLVLMEAPVQRSPRNLARSLLLKTKFFHSDTADDPRLPHEPLRRLVVHGKTSAV